MLASTRAADGFDARGDARSRTYCYRVLPRRERSAFERGRALWWPHRLDRDALHACAALLPGTHDFTAFTPTETDHVRFSRDVLGARWDERGDLLEFWIEADTFMRHMNRALVGTMLEVGGRAAVGGGLRGAAGRPPARRRRADGAAARALPRLCVRTEGGETGHRGH